MDDYNYLDTGRVLSPRSRDINELRLQLAAKDQEIARLHVALRAATDTARLARCEADALRDARDRALQLTTTRPICDCRKGAPNVDYYDACRRRSLWPHLRPDCG